MVRKSNEEDLGSVIKNLFRSYHIDGKVYAIRIKEVWEKVMGKTMQRYTTDITLKDGVLTLYISSAPLRQELKYNTDQIAQRINAEFEEEVVREVHIR